MYAKLKRDLFIFIAFFAIVAVACECGATAPATPVPPPPPTETPRPKAEQSILPCSMMWLNPLADGSSTFPAAGKVGFDWAPETGAKQYEVTVTYPNGNTVKYLTTESGKDLFMENYSEAGGYTVTVDALNANGEILCSISTTFSKQGTAKKESEDSSPGSSSSAKPESKPTQEVPK